MQALHSQTLTKKLLQSLPEGAYVISNIGWPPAFAARVPAPSDRADLWQQAKETGAAGRLCVIAPSRMAARAELRTRDRLRGLNDAIRQARTSGQARAMKQCLSVVRSIDRLQRLHQRALGTPYNF